MNNNGIPKQELSKCGVDAVIGIAGGVALSFLGFFISKMFPPLGIALGAVITVLGISGIFSKSKIERRSGAVTALIGAVLVLSFSKIAPPVTALAGTLLSACAFVSFGLGIWNGIRFLLGLKKIS